MIYNRFQILDQVYRGENRRFTQDTPILYEVWAKYLEAWDQHLKALKDKSKPPPKDESWTPRIELLLTPFEDPTSPEATAGRLAFELFNRLRDRFGDRSKDVKDSKIAYHQSAVVATLDFEDLVQVILPMSKWWKEKVLGRLDTTEVRRHGTSAFNLIEEIKRPEIQEELVIALSEQKPKERRAGRGSAHKGKNSAKAARKDGPDAESEEKISIDAIWLVRVLGLVKLYMSKQPSPTSSSQDELALPAQSRPAPPLSKSDARKIVGAAHGLLKGVVPYEYMNPDGLTRLPVLFAVNCNQKGSESVMVSSKTVKSDAVDRVFGVDCKSITWAVVDSGIDAQHMAFRRRRAVVLNKQPDGVSTPEPGANKGTSEVKQPEKVVSTRVEQSFPDAFELIKENGRERWLNHTRVTATYDFTRIRDLMQPGLDLKNRRSLPAWLQDAVHRAKKDDNLKQQLTVIESNVRLGRMVEWNLLSEILRIKHDDSYEPPARSHGTHVAGIIGADWKVEDNCPEPEGLRGLCPSIQLCDMRVIGPDGTTDSFTVMAALQFARSTNTHNEVRAIHGVNLSLSIPQNPRSFACGRTPVCDEADRLVGSGTVVVAAAGNSAFLAENSDGEASLNDVFRSITITDPGNAEAVITVGSTHREKPHQYGVSYFSSRGPTADGRIKPDLVAPGEKIVSTIPGNSRAPMDGTSQAAPHVSAAAALLMARHSELIGRPAQIKRILCESATDLGRYRFFQGHGLLDILRALQSV